MTTALEASAPVATSSVQPESAETVLARYADPYIVTGQLAEWLRRQTVGLRGYMDKLRQRKGGPQYDGDENAQTLFHLRLTEQVAAVDALLLITGKYCDGLVGDGINACAYGQYDCNTGNYKGLCECALPRADKPAQELPCSGETYFRTAEIAAMAGRALDSFLTAARNLGYIIGGRTFVAANDKQQTLGLRHELQGLRLSMQALLDA
jgi:hypothetical protein